MDSRGKCNQPAGGHRRRPHHGLLRTISLLCVAWTLLGALPANAELRGVSLYERGDYKRARAALEQDLRSGQLSKEDRVKAQLYLAAALHALGSKEDAQRQLDSLAQTAPELQVDPLLFAPDFVAMAERARKNAEAQRQELAVQRLEEERKRLEEERKRLEAARQAPAQGGTPPAQGESPAQRPPETPPTVVEESKPVHLRPELFGFVDPLGKSRGLGGGLTLGLGGMDVNAHVLGGDNLGFGAEVGLLLGSGGVQPRLALRGTAVPGAKAYGGGGVAGLRLKPTARFTVLVDVGAEYFKVQDPSEYRSFVLSGSAGVGFDLL